MKERITDLEFIENMRKGLAPLIGRNVKVTVRVTSKTDLRTYSGLLVSLENENVDLGLPTFRDGKIVSRNIVKYNLLDVHYYSLDGEPLGYKWTPPLRFRKWGSRFDENACDHST